MKNTTMKTLPASGSAVPGEGLPRFSTGRTNLFRGLLFTLLFLTLHQGIFAQEHGANPDFQKAREETAVVTDLGRLFSFMLRMDKEEPSLKISRDQARELSRIAEEIQTTERLTPSRTKEVIQRIEDHIFTPAQLLYTDRLFMGREDSRNPGTGTGAEGSRGGGNSGGGAGSSGAAGTASQGSSSSSGSGSIATYLAGGPFNPLLDGTRPQGRDFQEFRRMVRERAVE